MKRFTMFACLALTLVFAMNAFATDLPQRVIGHDSVFHGGSTEFSKSSRDTVFLIGPWGSGAQVNGQFEDPAGNPAWNGWTHWDITQPVSNHWHVSDYYADVFPSGIGNFAMYCGIETIPACSETDVDGGYGNSWNDILQFNYTVADPGAGCVVTVNGLVSHNTEPGYDYTNFTFQTSNGPMIQQSLDGVGVNRPFNSGAGFSYSYSPAEYMGLDSDVVRFEITITSDGAWSDEDCLYSGNGAAQIDDVTITCSNGGYNDTENFDETWVEGDGNWILAFPIGTGDFTDLWQGLEDVDPCFTNYTPQVAFIDDGTKVPGVGPSNCQDWCYGPGGYIVNTTGGAAILTNPDAYMYNAIESPVLLWPGPDYIGSQLTFGVYRHEDLSADAPGMFYTWSVRSALNDTDILNAGWMDRNFVYYGGPDYVRAGDTVSDLLEPGLTHAQVQLTCYELGWAFGWFGDDGYPAPYFDNVRYTAYTTEGPGMATREIDLAQDNFPEIGTINLNILADNNVRFDLAMNKGDDDLNMPGDSIVCDVASVRVGGQLVTNRLVYTVNANPLFDPARSYPMNGSVDAQPAVNSAGNVVPGKFAYDLPDSGFLFPGDVLHYYFEAIDEVDNANPQPATLPADITGFGDFSDPLAYNTGFEVHCLPTVAADDSNPGILFWNDFANRGGENEWFSALNNLGLTMGVDYDAYYTNGPSSGVGNGLGGRSTDDLMARYGTLLYTVGDLGISTIANGDPTFDPSADVQLLTNYIAQNSVNVFMTGDELVSDLMQSGGLTNTFLQDYINVVRTSNDIRPLINNQATPLVLPISGNPVFTTSTSWIAYGGCNGINTFDAVDAGPGATRLATFTNPQGVASYSYSAATLNLTANDRIITMPYDFMYIYTAPGDPAPDGVAMRVNVLGEVLGYFGLTNPGWNPTPVPAADKFFATNYPNPFNPSTKIEFNMPKEGHLSLKI